MIAEVDDDNNGYCEYDEFLLLMSKKINEGQMDEEMMEAFKTFDEAGKGYINLNDLKRVLKQYNENLSDEEVTILFHETDADKDNKINFKDFILMMMAK
jgi:calmodulin